MHKATSLQITTKSLILLFLPLAIYIIPYEWWFTGESFCLYKLLFGIECWGCGITRACIAALYGNFNDALIYHPAVFIVLPILIGVWIKHLWLELKYKKK